MDAATYSSLVNLIWTAANDALHFVYDPTDYRNVFLPFVVIRRLDAVLEPSKAAVVAMKAQLDEGKVPVQHQDQVLRGVAGRSFYNTSPLTLTELGSRTSQAGLRGDFETFLDGFSPNVQDIIKNFGFRVHVARLSDADRLGTMIATMLNPLINLSPNPVLNADGTVRLQGLDNHAMGTIFEELLRRFNEQNNAQAGQFWTPRDAVNLMARLVFDPVADQIESSAYTLYDGACGTGGMLTIAEERLHELTASRGKSVSTHLYGQEIQPVSYAICKADMLLKGDGEQADHIMDRSTLARDAFPDRTFDFMLSNPPYGVTWKADQEIMSGADGITDPRFRIQHAGNPAYDLTTRSNDGQMLFLANMLSKMKRGTKLGSRIAEVHNGSSLFTGNAGQGESNIRRWIIENDWLEAIVALPLNMFYNTGIATYIWLLTNKKPAHRAGKVQLIDATGWSRSLRKNLGSKNCEVSEDDIARICETHKRFEDDPQSRVLPNAAFGYSKVAVCRPLRLSKLSPHVAYSPKELKLLRLPTPAGPSPVVVDPGADPVIAKIHKGAKVEADPLRGLFARTIQGKPCVVEYHPDPELADTEQVPLVEAGGIDAFLRREVLPHAPDAWYDPASVKIGYEVSFTRYFYKPPAQRTLAEIRADIVALERETDGLLAEIIGSAG